MEQDPCWEAGSRSDGQEIPHLLRNLNDHYRVHKAPGSDSCPEPFESKLNLHIIFL